VPLVWLVSSRGRSPGWCHAEAKEALRLLAAGRYWLPAAGCRQARFASFAGGAAENG